MPRGFCRLWIDRFFKKYNYFHTLGYGSICVISCNYYLKYGHLFDRVPPQGQNSWEPLYLPISLVDTPIKYSRNRINWPAVSNKPVGYMYQYISLLAKHIGLYHYLSMSSTSNALSRFRKMSILVRAFSMFFVSRTVTMSWLESSRTFRDVCTSWPRVRRLPSVPLASLIASRNFLIVASRCCVLLCIFVSVYHYINIVDESYIQCLRCFILELC